MDTKHVKNISGMTLEVIGVGIVEADETVEVPADFHNANFEEVKKSPAPKIETKNAPKGGKDD